MKNLSVSKFLYCIGLFSAAEGLAGQKIYTESAVACSTRGDYSGLFAGTRCRSDAAKERSTQSLLVGKTRFDCRYLTPELAERGPFFFYKSDISVDAVEFGDWPEMLFHENIFGTLVVTEYCHATRPDISSVVDLDETTIVAAAVPAVDERYCEDTGIFGTYATTLDIFIKTLIRCAYR
jgi:hypothetical protein